MLKKVISKDAIPFVATIGVVASIAYMCYRAIDVVQEKIVSYVRQNIICTPATSQARAIECQMFREYAEEKFFQPLRKGLDKESNDVLDYVLDSLCYNRFLKYAVWENYSVRLSEEMVAHKNKWEIEKKHLNEKYKLDEKYFAPEIFYFHHGLRFADKKILDYIADKDIIDCGAYVGDSALVLRNYTNKTVYCYEFVEPNIDTFKTIMKENNVKDSEYKLIPMALGNEVRSFYVKKADVPQADRMLIERTEGNLAPVNMTTIDEEYKKHNFNVGFIKMDVEGFGLNIIRGAINTIKGKRPVLSLAVYHNSAELFGIKPFLEENLDNYVFEFKLQEFNAGEITEMILFCYPKEIMNEKNALNLTIPKQENTKVLNKN